MIVVFLGNVNRDFGVGIKIMSSRSNTKNKIRIRKNCIEKLYRADFLVSNPHSKGDIF